MIHIHMYLLFKHFSDDKYFILQREPLTKINFSTT